jgi:cytochrome P450
MLITPPDSAMPEPVHLAGGLPLVGHAAKLIFRPLEFLQKAHGHGDVVTIGIGRKKAYFVNHPDTLRTMLLTDAARFDKGVHFDKVRSVIGNGLPASSGSFHRKQRKLIRPAFHQASLRAYFDTMMECALARTRSWESASRIDLHAELHAIAIAISVKALASTDIGPRESARMERWVTAIAVGASRRMVDPTGLLEKLPIPSNWRFDRARTGLRTLFDQIIQDYRQNNAVNPDALSILLASYDEQNSDGMSDIQLRDEVISLILAALETTAQALKWLFYVFGEHPDVQQRVREEVDMVSAGGTVAFADMEKFTYTRRVIAEVLRLYPPLYLISRRPTADVQIAGCRIPAGSMVLFSPYALHRDPSLYPEPDRFDPDRWLPDANSQRPQVSYIPFGMGIRSCIGEQFALNEMLVVVTCVLTDWTVHKVPSITVRPRTAFVLSPSAAGVALEPRS